MIILEKYYFDDKLLIYVKQLLEGTDFVVEHESNNTVSITHCNSCYFYFGAQSSALNIDSLKRKMEEYTALYEGDNDLTHSSKSKPIYLTLIKHLLPFYTSPMYLGNKFGI